MKRIVSVLALLVTIFAVAAASAVVEQTALASQMTRLHVVANSDSEIDQQLKLRVRDAVLEAANSQSAATSANDGYAALPFEAMEKAAAATLLAAGYEYDVTVTRGIETFGTREYDSFRLPAGNYDAVRVTIGEGEGKNWWCVLFPPLCFASAEQFEQTAREAGFSDGDIAVMSGGDEVVIKFRILELLADWFK